VGVEFVERVFYFHVDRVEIALVSGRRTDAREAL
jgi:hypothetical protein